ncbi:glycosyltransferase family 4 protein [Henriciella sp.]|uniref:glycosyltransferase family 4 protein n=1 Tax=Henriciella sp. TaxID=1968823 RepID=UPI000C0DA20F|nr:glycosyltransferase family 4 protein [Henriciella sp.]PHR70211.1 MAG: hypothetical protein COA64_16145 [Henriciella sp.]
MAENMIAAFKTACRALVLPRRTGQADASDPATPVVVAGMFRTGSGLGRAATACVSAIRRHGVTVHAVDLSEALGQVDASAQIALSEMPETRSGTLILFANPPEVIRALTVLGIRRWQDWRLIGAWAWELPKAPSQWRETSRFFSEVWVPSQFVADAVRPVSEAPVAVVPHHVPPPPPELLESPWDEGQRPFTCLLMGDGRSSFHRKNVKEGLLMFRSAFPERRDVKLIIKCRNTSESPQVRAELEALVADDDRMSLLDETLDYDDMLRLMSRCDVLLSPHRAEGFGFGLAEAMSLGLAVVATGWSGNLDFMPEGTSVLLPYTMETVEDPDRIYPTSRAVSWAKADMQAGVAALQFLHSDPEARRTLGRRAAEHIRKALDGSAYFRQLGWQPSSAERNHSDAGT